MLFFLSKDKLAKNVAWKAIQYATKRGMARQLPIIMVGLAISLATRGEMRTAQELGNVSLALSGKIHQDKENYALTWMVDHGCIVILKCSYFPRQQRVNTAR